MNYKFVKVNFNRRLLKLIEGVVAINVKLALVAALALIVLLLWIKKKEFRYSRSIKILLYILLICNGIILFSVFSVVFSALAVILVAVALVWVKLFFFD
ncbi:MAG: hypothetical protein KAQ64_00770 [Candidatus Pacebacteria bacterium]|nr:hypothetical protein [Candidatus Paceibacterota bacterium]